MGNPFFRFKRFVVRQEGAAMKVGTDGVLVGAWARVVPGQARLLDIGAGTGLIALMLAQRTEGCGARIDAVEIEPESFRQAVFNVNESPWSGRITIRNGSVQDFAAEQERRSVYNHIISNPPYFVNSLFPPGEGRTIARHASALTFPELCRCASLMLAPEGIFTVIIPAESAADLIRDAAAERLYLSRNCTVYSVEGGPAKRALLEFSRTETVVELTELRIEGGTPRDYTPKYRELTKDFYLKF